jgi:hypothetical protein
MVVKPKNIDEYLAAMSDDKRAALERLRKIIRAAVPRAEECISYQLPAFRIDGKCFVWFGAAANHCAIYGVLGDHKDELKITTPARARSVSKPTRPCRLPSCGS